MLILFGYGLAWSDCGQAASRESNVRMARSLSAFRPGFGITYEDVSFFKERGCSMPRDKRDRSSEGSEMNEWRVTACAAM
jgi:hypothetical protein